MDECSHPIRLGTLCGICGADIAEEDHLFCALYNTDNVRITHNEAIAIYNEKLKTLELQKKLILVLDLDQTILHTVCDAPPLVDTTSFVIENKKYCVKLRPKLKYMLDKISKLYEIHVYTMGTRAYAKKIVETIDPSREYFHDRIITRDENQGLLIKNLDRLFPYKHRNIVILDDRPDVWEFCKNLVLIKPFWYFNQIDINDPEILKKKIEKEAKRNKRFDGFVSKKRKVEKIRDSDVINKLEDMVLESSTEDDIDGAVCMDAMDSETPVSSSNASEGNTGDTDRREKASRSPHAEDVSEDSELPRVTKFLVGIHRKYFKSKHRNVKKILTKIRKKIFNKSRFFIPDSSSKAGITRMIEMYGGKVCGLDSRTDFIISSSRDGVEEMARKVGCLVISPKWIADCAYSLKRVNHGKYVVCDYRVKDEYEEELEKFFL